MHRYSPDDDADTMADQESTSSKDGTEIAIAYLSCPHDAAKHFLGALLITDARSRPLHFAYVAPVRPTPMQKLLYGATLADHVRVDVIAKKLFSDGISRMPDVMFVEDQLLLEVRRAIDVPTAHLQRRLQSGPDSASLSTVQYSVNESFDDHDTVGRLLSSLEQTVDLVEPFARIREALKEALKGEKI